MQQDQQQKISISLHPTGMQNFEASFSFSNMQLAMRFSNETKVESKTDDYIFIHSQTYTHNPPHQLEK
jgi:hypothetical protein